MSVSYPVPFKAPGPQRAAVMDRNQAMDPAVYGKGYAASRHRGSKVGHSRSMRNPRPVNPENMLHATRPEREALLSMSLPDGPGDLVTATENQAEAPGNQTLGSESGSYTETWNFNFGTQKEDYLTGYGFSYADQSQQVTATSGPIHFGPPRQPVQLWAQQAASGGHQSMHLGHSYGLPNMYAHTARPLEERYAATFRQLQTEFPTEDLGRSPQTAPVGEQYQERPMGEIGEELNAMHSATQAVSRVQRTNSQTATQGMLTSPLNTCVVHESVMPAQAPYVDPFPSSAFFPQGEASRPALSMSTTSWPSFNPWNHERENDRVAMPHIRNPVEDLPMHLRPLSVQPPPLSLPTRAVRGQQTRTSSPGPGIGSRAKARSIARMQSIPRISVSHGDESSQTLGHDQPQRPPRKRVNTTSTSGHNTNEGHKLRRLDDRSRRERALKRKVGVCSDCHDRKVKCHHKDFHGIAQSGRRRSAPQDLLSQAMDSPLSPGTQQSLSPSTGRPLASLDSQDVSFTNSLSPLSEDEQFVFEQELGMPPPTLTGAGGQFAPAYPPPVLENPPNRQG